MSEKLVRKYWKRLFFGSPDKKISGAFTMAQEEKIFTPEQKKVLNLISSEEYLTKRFYITGGTPLSAFYLFHRISEGLDLFFQVRKGVKIPKYFG